MRNAFSLVELSIVLVILGLLTGGILAGQSLIRAAELRSVATQLQNYETAIYTFRDKYQALPGDMRNAVKFWGAQAGGTNDGADSTCSALTQTSPATGKATCNGNGDGKIAQDTDSTQHYESFRAWQHLANAGLIEGTYSGVRGVGGTKHSVGSVNVPNGKISNSAIAIGHVQALVSNAANFDTPAGHQFWFGSEISTHVPYGNILRSEEAWGLDKKIDDGKPAYGKFLTPNNAQSPDCVTSDVSATAEYNLQTSSISCAVYYRLF